LKQRGKSYFSICSHYELTGAGLSLLLSLCSHFFPVVQAILKNGYFTAVHSLPGCSFLPRHTQRRSSFSKQCQVFVLFKGS